MQWITVTWTDWTMNADRWQDPADLDWHSRHARQVHCHCHSDIVSRWVWFQATGLGIVLGAWQSAVRGFASQQLPLFPNRAFLLKYVSCAWFSGQHEITAVRAIRTLPILPTGLLQCHIKWRSWRSDETATVSAKYGGSSILRSSTPRPRQSRQSSRAFIGYATAIIFQTAVGARKNELQTTDFFFFSAKRNNIHGTSQQRKKIKNCHVGS